MFNALSRAAEAVAPPRLSWPIRLAAAFVAVLLASWLQYAVLPEPEVAPFLLFFAGVALASWVGGHLAGLAAVLLSAAIANFVFVVPHLAWSVSRPALVATTTFLASASAVALLCGSLRSASHRARAQAKLLRQSERDLNRAQAVGQIGSWRLDVARNRLVWSRENHRIFGIPEGTPLDYEAFLAAVHPEDREAVHRAWKAALRGQPYDVEHRIVVRGETKWVRERAELDLDPDGAVRGGFGTTQDITERKHAEERLRGMAEALREADRRKSEFLAVLSHELRNPLAPIRNSLYVMSRAAAQGEQAERARAVIDRQVVHLTRLVDDLLDVTRIARGKIRLQRQHLDLATLVERTAEDHRSVYARGGIAFDVSVAERPLMVDGDATRLAQALGNLLVNAAKFTPRGGSASLHLDSDGRGQAVLRVRDSGMGIAPAVLPRLFEPFTQAEETLDRSRGGLGLGLALVKGFVELHGGRVSAHSDGSGKGAEFVMRLPLVKGAAVAARPLAARGPEVLQRRVLVIEDNLDAGESLKEALELNEHVVELATSGPQGIEKARSFRPDVVLCDIGLPGMDGYQVARELRADPELRSLHLIALTGYALPEDVERARQAGFEDHLSKPPSLELIEERLARVAVAPVLT